ncbi:MAG: PAS domain-containing protein, partial [Acidobacteriota bacterium]
MAVFPNVDGWARTGFWDRALDSESKPARPWQRLLATIFFVSAAVLFRVEFLGPLGQHIPYVTLFPAVMLAAVTGGLASGLLATSLSAGVAYFWFQGGVLDPGASLAMATFVASGVAMSVVGELNLRARARLRRSRDELRESEDKFRFVFEGSMVAKSMTLPTGALRVNQAFADMLGYSREELERLRWQDVTPPEDVEDVQRTVGPLLAGEGTSVRLVKRYVHRNGGILWADVTSSLRRDVEGKPLYFVTALLDITGLKKAEEALRTSEDRLRLALEAAGLGAWDLDLAQDKAWRSPRHDEIFGYDSLLPEWGYRQFIERVVPEDRERVDRTFHGALEAGPLDFECRIARPDGEVRWISVHGRVYFGGDGKPHRASGTILDVTDDKHAQEELQKAQERLLLSQKAAGIGHFSWDIRNNVNEWSDELMALYGLLPGGFGGKYESWRERLFPDDLA